MRQARTHTAALAVLVAVALLTGCKRKAEVHRPADLTALARQAAEDNIRSTTRAPASVKFRGVQVYRQAATGQFAVCGQANVFGGMSETFVLFVAVATIAPDSPASAPRFAIEQLVAGTPADASRVYVETVARCFDKGGPQPALPGGTTPLPPLPASLDQERQPQPSAPPPPSGPLGPPGGPQTPAVQPSAPAAPPPGGVSEAPSQAPAGQDALLPATPGTVTMLQNGNLHAVPQGDVVRVVPKGTTMQVFGVAPGGWYQVGDTAPWGWVHGSMVERH
jgi:hypothetical protein